MDLLCKVALELGSYQHYAQAISKSIVWGGLLVWAVGLIMWNHWPKSDPRHIPKKTPNPHRIFMPQQPYEYLPSFNMIHTHYHMRRWY